MAKPPKVPLSGATKAALAAAHNAAAVLGHNYIAPEHLLLGLMRAGDQTFRDILVAINLRPETVAARVEQRMTAASHASSRRRPMTNWADAAVSLARSLAASADDPVVQPEHVLAALLARQRGAAFDVLHDLGAAGQPVLSFAKRLRKPT